MDTITEKSKTSVAKFEDFFSTEYKDAIFEALEKYPDERSVLVDYLQLEMFDPDLADLLIEKPEEIIKAAGKAIKNIDTTRKNADLNVRFQNLSNIIPLKDLKSKYIGKFVAVDGIIRKTSEIHPRIVSAMFECRSCMRLHEVPQKSNMVSEPALCNDCGGRSFRLLQEESGFLDTQTTRLQEPLENLSGGEQPRQINVVLEDDLVDTITPGDIIRIIGTFKTARDEKTKLFKNYIYCNYVEVLEQEFEELQISKEDEEKIKKLASDSDVYNKIINSTAPSIQGYREVKEAIALQLFGGSPKELEDKTRIRGDIHILIVGDPGIGKSQMLKYVSKLAPRGIYTSGKGTSAVGLTAAAVKDDLGGWSLEAGALVLGDRGNVCVDELDKMRPEDRSAIHEALEQQSYHQNFEILLADGKKVKIGDFIDKYLKKEKSNIIYGKDTEILSIDDLYVMAYDLEKMEIANVKADRISRHKAPGKFVKIKFGNGRYVTVTPEHPILIWDKEIKAVRADKIEEEDLVLGVNEYYSSTNSNLNSNTAAFLGFILSEGHTYKNESNGSYEVGFSNTDIKLVEEFKHILEKQKIKYCVSVREKEGWKTQYLHPQIAGDGDIVYTVRIISKAFYHNLLNEFPEVFLRTDAMRPARAKSRQTRSVWAFETKGFERVPNKIMMDSEDVKKAFLNAYFKGDGFVDNYRTGYSTASIKMAEDLQDLLLMSGVYSYIFTEKRDERIYYKVTVSGKENMEKFAEIIKDDHRIERVNDLINTSANKNNDRDVLPNEIAQNLNNILKKLRISDGRLVNNINRKQNAHRLTLSKYVEKVEEVLKEISVSREIDIKSAKRIFTVEELSKKLNVPHSTLRYRLMNGDEETIKILLNEANKRFIKVKKDLKLIKKYVQGNVRFVKVKKVELVENTESKWVYDITVEPQHLFVSHGLVLHNTISIAKAGIMATLNSRCAMLAAANPKFGRFDRYKSIAEQINLPSTILSRFDLIFIVEDKPDAEKDKKLAGHILNIHKNTSILFEIDPELLRKYIAYARKHAHPKLTQGAIEVLQEFYVGMRGSAEDDDSPVPITARQLEALVRLSEANCKIRLGKEVTAEDAKRAIRLQQECMKQVGLDPETGKVDIDKVEGRTPKSERDKALVLIDIVKELSDEYGGRVPVSILTDEMSDRYNVSEDKVLELINKLKQQGLVFEPQTGYLKTV
ncbi:MAG: LAGLIDADG family homing endonuclease [Methanobacteriaceae archaeon]|jgi:replicative DNA helicase Mcm